MHTHFSALAAAGAFLSVAIVGGVWRLGAAHLVVSPNPTLSTVGKAMLFQY